MIRFDPEDKKYANKRVVNTNNLIRETGIRPRGKNVKQYVN